MPLIPKPFNSLTSKPVIKALILWISTGFLSRIPHLSGCQFWHLPRISVIHQILFLPNQGFEQSYQTKRRRKRTTSGPGIAKSGWLNMWFRIRMWAPDAKSKEKKSHDGSFLFIISKLYTELQQDFLKPPLWEGFLFCSFEFFPTRHQRNSHLARLVSHNLLSSWRIDLISQIIKNVSLLAGAVS